MVLKTGGAFHPAFSKEIYNKRLQGKKEDKPKRKAEKNHRWFTHKVVDPKSDHTEKMSQS